MSNEQERDAMIAAAWKCHELENELRKSRQILQNIVDEY